MKRYLFKIAAMMLVLAGLTSCQNQQPKNRNVDLKNLRLSLCDDNLKSAEMEDEDRGHINYSAIDNKTLKIEQKFFMNCCAENIDAIINTDDNMVTINIMDDDAGCNCICPRITNYEIVNLKENETYKFIFLRNGQEHYTCEILFTIHVDGEIQL